MKTTIKLMSVVAPILVALTLTACGSEQDGMLANIAPPVDKPTQLQADKMMNVSSKSTSVGNSSNAMSMAARSSIKGITVDISDMTDERELLNIKVTYVEQVSEQCLFPTFSTNAPVKKSDLLSKFVTVPNLGRIQCIDSGCAQLLLVIDKFRNSDVTVPVVMLNSGDDELNYIPQESLKEFTSLASVYLRTNDIVQGKAVCEVNTGGEALDPDGDGGTPSPYPINVNGSFF